MGKCCSLLQLPSQTWALLLLRLFLGLRLLTAALAKFTTRTPEGTVFSWTTYQNIAQGLLTKFQTDTFLPTVLLTPYTYGLAWGELLLGLALLLGFKTRGALVLSGLLFVSLAFGQMLVNGTDIVVQIAVYLALTVLALLLVEHDRFCVCSCRKKASCCPDPQPLHS